MSRYPDITRFPSDKEDILKCMTCLRRYPTMNKILSTYKRDVVGSLLIIGSEVEQESFLINHLFKDPYDAYFDDSSSQEDIGTYDNNEWESYSLYEVRVYSWSLSMLLVKCLHTAIISCDLSFEDGVYEDNLYFLTSFLSQTFNVHNKLVYILIVAFSQVMSILYDKVETEGGSIILFNRRRLCSSGDKKQRLCSSGDEGLTSVGNMGNGNMSWFYYPIVTASECLPAEMPEIGDTVKASFSQVISVPYKRHVYDILCAIILSASKHFPSDGPFDRDTLIKKCAHISPEETIEFINQPWILILLGVL